MITQKAISIAEEYLRQGKSGIWSWESCVEDVAKELGYETESTGLEAVNHASRQLNRSYPYKGAESTAIWARVALAPIEEATRVVKVIRNKFIAIEENPTPDYSMASRSRLRELVQSCNDPLATHVIDLLETPFHCFPRQGIPAMPGVYALWRAANYGTLVYVGESKNIAQRVSDHLPTGKYPWWGRSMMWVTYSIGDELAESRLRKGAEALAIQLLEPSSQ